MGITKGGGFPYPISFNPIGYKTSGNPLAPLKKCGMIQYSKGSTNGVLIDKIGKSTRPAITAKYINQPGLTADIGLNNEALTYFDVDTMLDVVSATDASGVFTFPSAKVANIKIPSDGSIFYLQEGLGNTIADSVNGRVVKLNSNATFTSVNNIQSQADIVGYTVSDASTYFWDLATTDVIANGVIIPNLSSAESVAFVVVVAPWILAGGIWNDIGVWDDSALWID